MFKSTLLLSIILCTIGCVSAKAQETELKYRQDCLVAIKGIWYFDKVDISMFEETDDNKAWKAELDKKWKRGFTDGHRLYFSDSTLKKCSLILGVDDDNKLKGSYDISLETEEDLTLTFSNGTVENYRIILRDKNKTMILIATSSSGALAEIVLKKSI
jgi:hypothetical protein